MKIVLDIMGGDFAPDTTIEGALLADEALPPHVKLILVGNKQVIESTIKAKKGAISHFTIVHAREQIGMDEHPTKALLKKPNSSIALGFKLLKHKLANAIVGAGNTGAMMVGGMFALKTIPGIIRPTIISIIPKESGKLGVIADVGANADCKADVLAKFGNIGSVYAKHVLHIKNPKVGLLNLGEEEQKGTLLTQAAYQLLKMNNKINFIGNVEGRDLFNQKADVIVSDGFNGNVVLKLVESFYDILKKRNLMDDFITRFNYDKIGGCPILGLNGTVVIGHGLASGEAIKNMVLLAKEMVQSNVVGKMQKEFN